MRKLERQSFRNLAALAALVGSVVLGLVLCLAAMPALFAALPSDLARTGHLLRALEGGAASPEIAVLGNSVVMAGVDARQLSQGLPGRPLVYNLASGAQAPAESFLYYQQLPNSVRVIVQAVSADALQGDRGFLPQVYNAFYMYGYRPERATRSALVASFGPAMSDLLALSGWQQRLKARWSPRQVVDFAVRRWLRPDLRLDMATRDLFFPQPYTERLPERKLDIQFRPYETPRAAKGLRISKEMERLLGEMQHAADTAGRRFIVVIAPVHPRMQRYFGAEFMDDLALLSDGDALGGSITIIDMSPLLDASQFIDRVHPTPEGARIWTSHMADRLEKLI